MPLPPPETVLAAMERPMFGQAVRRLYGLAAE
jgi:hypothetical protein